MKTEEATHAYLHRKASEVGAAWTGQLDRWHDVHDGCTIVSFVDELLDLKARLASATRRAGADVQRVRLGAAMQLVEEAGRIEPGWPPYRHVFDEVKSNEAFDAMETRLRFLTTVRGA